MNYILHHETKGDQRHWSTFIRWIMISGAENRLRSIIINPPPPGACPVVHAFVPRARENLPFMSLRMACGALCFVLLRHTQPEHFNLATVQKVSGWPLAYRSASQNTEGTSRYFWRPNCRSIIIIIFLTKSPRFAGTHTHTHTHIYIYKTLTVT
jgi:hypothetical protein